MWWEGRSSFIPKQLKRQMIVCSLKVIKQNINVSVYWICSRSHYVPLTPYECGWVCFRENELEVTLKRVQIKGCGQKSAHWEASVTFLNFSVYLSQKVTSNSSGILHFRGQWFTFVSYLRIQKTFSDISKKYLCTVKAHCIRDFTRCFPNGGVMIWGRFSVMT